MRLGDGARAILLLGMGALAIVTQGVPTTSVIGLAVALLLVALMLERTVPH